MRILVRLCHTVHKPYFVNLSTISRRGEGAQNVQKTVTHGLWIPPSKKSRDTALYNQSRARTSKVVPRDNLNLQGEQDWIRPNNINQKSLNSIKRSSKHRPKDSLGPYGDMDLSTSDSLGIAFES